MQLVLVGWQSGAHFWVLGTVMLPGAVGTQDCAPAEALKKPVGQGVHVLDPWALKDPATTQKLSR